MNAKIFVAIVALAALGIGYYALSPLFNTVVVDDALPESVTVQDGMPSGAEALPPEEKEKFDAEMKAANAGDPVSMDEPVPAVDARETTHPVMGTAGHPASGQVRVIETTDGTIIRYEDFSTINGPRLHVYLAKDLDGNEFVDLGPIKGTQGNINYTVPADVSLDEYPYVMYWCVPFGVLFNYAELRQSV